MNMFQKTLTGLMTMVMLSACTKETLRGDGSVITETRTLSAFDAVSLSGIREIELIKSNESKVELTGYANLIAALESNVSGNRLSFRYPNNTRVRNDNVRLKIYTPDIETIQQSGVTRCILRGGFDFGTLRITLSGKSRIESDINQAENIHLEISGDSRVMLRNLTATNTQINASGSSEVEVTVTDWLKINASGATRIYYWGPVGNVDVSTTGTAKAVRK